MATHSEVSISNPRVQSPLATNNIRWSLIAGIILVLVIFGAAIVWAIPALGQPASSTLSDEAWSARYQGMADQMETARLRQAYDAAGARYLGMANEYLDQNSPKRAAAAESARYQGMADRLEETGQQHLGNAWAARYQGLAEEASLKKNANAWSARYQGLADQLPQNNFQPASDSWTARLQGLADQYNAVK